MLVRRFALYGAVFALALAQTACGDDTTDTDAGTALDAGSGDDSGTPADSGTGNQLDSPAKILAFLDGKSLVMEGANIPSHPNGFDENTDFGAFSQCYNKTTIDVSAGVFTVTAITGTFVNMMCDNAAAGATVGPFSSTNIRIENVNTLRADCFDIQVDYPGYSQVGRARFNADQSEIWMELYFAANSPTGHTCADGAVGEGADTQNIQGTIIPFSGDATQKYVINN